ncbi:nucleotide exchange factor GrpE [Clostridium bornimense]|uniref:nucleotide exchange factor GrpE n=1 Tax=Clostridium bornimense TaxID=1216932 RepID=UPI001C11D3E4|nr:nucleotide exchange factor GrpE [Clostridium bornimense]MBU5316537.1 nucleotide exchange factor GrpE [Clostridium bornimense]
MATNEKDDINIHIGEELELFPIKKLTMDDKELDDLYGPFVDMEEKMRNIEKANKKNTLIMDTIKAELDEKNKKIRELESTIREYSEREDKLVKKVIKVLDQIDYIDNFAKSTEDEALINNMNTVKKIIRKELREVGIEEIPTVGEIYNQDLHQCIDAVEDDTKTKYEIVDVVKRGYLMNGKVKRTASVIAVK